MIANAFLLGTSCILTSMPMIRNLSWRNQIHLETTHHIDHATTKDLVSSSHESSVGRVSCDVRDGVHAIGRVLVPQLTRQLRLLGIVTVTQQRLDEGAVHIRVGRRCHDCSVQIDVDLIEERMKLVIQRTHKIANIEIGSVGSRHLLLEMQLRLRNRVSRTISVHPTR